MNFLSRFRDTASQATSGNSIDVVCEDFLKGNSHFYATKATRKKIALIRVELQNRLPSDVQVMFSASSLTASGKSYAVEKPAVIVRKLSEFTWDFLLFAITDIFNPVVAIIESFVFLGGPLYNRRLRRKLKRLSDEDMDIPAGKSVDVLLAFRRVGNGLEELTIPYRTAGGESEQIRWEFKTAAACS